MELTIPEIKAKARGCLEGHYGSIIFAIMLARLMTNLPSLILSSMAITNTTILSLIEISVSLIISFISAIFVVGQNYMCLRFARTNDLVVIGEMWYGFIEQADRTIMAYFFMVVRMLIPSIPFIACMALLSRDLSNVTFMVASIITGIIMAIAIFMLWLDYSLVFFLIIDYPDADPYSLLAMSKEMMKGHRLKYLGLIASFFGMYLLVILSFGVGIFWVYPYYKTSITQFYLGLIGEKSPVDQLLEGNLTDPDYFKEVTE